MVDSLYSTGGGFMNDEERELFYEAGFVAGRLGWPNPDVISTSEIALLVPTGDPALVVSGREGLTLEQARTIAAISGAGRPIRVVTTHTPPGEVLAWLPNGCLHVIGQDVATPLNSSASSSSSNLLTNPAERESSALNLDDVLVSFFFDEFSDVQDMEQTARVHLAAGMREVKVGLAWDRHIWVQGREASYCLLCSDVITEELRHRECWARGWLDSVGASFTLNVRIDDQAILLLCGPWSDDSVGRSGPATASRPFDWGLCDRMDASVKTDQHLGFSLLFLQEGPDIDIARNPGTRALGDIPDHLRQIPGGEDAVWTILRAWAIGLFACAQDSGVTALQHNIIEVDEFIKGTWDAIVADLA